MGKFEGLVRRKIGMGGLLNEVRTFLRQFSLAPLIQQLAR